MFLNGKSRNKRVSIAKRVQELTALSSKSNHTKALLADAKTDHGAIKPAESCAVVQVP